MQVFLCTDQPDDVLEAWRTGTRDDDWQLVIDGFWNQTPYHSGHVSYFLQKRRDGIWVMDQVQRPAVLDGVTQEDVDEGLLNDEQIQAMWGTTLEEAQARRYARIAAVLIDAPADYSPADIATMLYRCIGIANGRIVDEVRFEGLLEDI
ncbi:MAG: hypothetical protein V2J02_12445 [Pseudomonadales bacterium]|jgi:hypothetical protein|nr:hypothetical protein [Pseudomonadales bacterium]